MPTRSAALRPRLAKERGVWPSLFTRKGRAGRATNDAAGQAHPAGCGRRAESLLALGLLFRSLFCGGLLVEKLLVDGRLEKEHVVVKHAVRAESLLVVEGDAKGAGEHGRVDELAHGVLRVDGEEALLRLEQLALGDRLLDVDHLGRQLEALDDTHLAIGVLDAQLLELRFELVDLGARSPGHLHLECRAVRDVVVHQRVLVLDNGAVPSEQQRLARRHRHALGDERLELTDGHAVGQLGHLDRVLAAQRLDHQPLRRAGDRRAAAHVPRALHRVRALHGLKRRARRHPERE
mmetsp:Transcript_21641/g.53172  ORF Transcript_21641/g.53172 Transcript_21641/m.53172 type:complete len:292 (-) Transcript_21641:122-997(-)